MAAFLSSAKKIALSCFMAEVKTTALVDALASARRKYAWCARRWMHRATMLCDATMRKEAVKLAALERYTTNAVSYILRHNTRENPKPPSNIDIDPTRSQLNDTLTPERGDTARQCKDYYNSRLNEVYHMNRSDIITACQWVITAPADLAQEQEQDFFKESYAYLNHLYGQENCVQCTVHRDEGVKDKDGQIVAGRSHMHYVFLPVVENKKYMVPNKKGNITKIATYQEKLCADELITKKHLKAFHPDFQRWLDNAGIKCTVHSGVTGGKNRTVEALKTETREILLQKERIATLEAENQALKDRIKELEKELSHKKEHEHTKSTSWGTRSGWGKEISWEKEF